MSGSNRLALLAMVVATGCFDREPLSNGHIDGTVMLAAPVADARVTVWRLWPNGEERGAPIAVVQTDGLGRFSFDTGTHFGPLRFVADGGTVDTVANTLTLEAVDLDFDVGDQWIRGQHGVTISPLTTLATELGRRRVDTRKLDYVDGMKQAYQAMRDHFTADIAGDVVADLTGAADADDATLHGIMLAGLSALANRMAREGGISPLAFTVVDLTRALLDDLQDAAVIFDGEGKDGMMIKVGACDDPPGCPPEGCRKVCELGANTLRADLAGAVVYDFFPSLANGTGLGASDFAAAIKTLRENRADILFGGVSGAPIPGPRIAIEVSETYMDDESQDIVTFSANSAPIHQASGVTVALGNREDCNTVVYKHVTRLDDPGDNPLRWRFTVTSPGVWIDEMHGGEYRVGLQGGDWFTDWRTAETLPSGDNGNDEEVGSDRVDYQVDLLRSDLPELATVRGTFEIEFRGTDVLGQQATLRRCWQHVPLAAPLDIRPAREATGPESLHAWGLEQGKALAPLLNGVPLNQGAGIMEFEIRNGTDEPVYITLGYDQPVVTYGKDWIETSALVRTGDIVQFACWTTSECALSWPTSRQTTDPGETTGVRSDLIGGLRVWDVTTTATQKLRTCDGCDAGEYRLEARLDPQQPRVYRVMLVANSLAELAPSQPGDPPLLYQDAALHDLYASDKIVTGVRYRWLDVDLCIERDWLGLTCVDLSHYAYYRALQQTWLTATRIQATAETSPISSHPPRLQAVDELAIENYLWSTVEEPQLPAPTPPP